MAKYTLYLAAVVLAVAAFESVVGYPRYIAIPIEDVQFLSELPAATRHRRQVGPGPAGGPGRRFRPQPVALVPAADRAEFDGPVDDGPVSDDRHVRQAGAGYGGRYVDYGAYTGNKGAFGWYTDHPVGKY